MIQFKLVAGLLLIAASMLAGGVVEHYRSVMPLQLKQAQQEATIAAAQLAKNQADNAKLKTLEETKNANIVQIDKLHADNHALWLRLPKADCAGTTSQTSTDPASAVGELPTQDEIALKRFTEGLADEARRADGIVESCRVLNGMN